MILSIIICTFNRAAAIIPCLEAISASISKASVGDVEIIVVDNNSSDDTSNVITKWSKNRAVPLVLIQEPRQGISAARNAGIRKAAGKLLIFVDDDCRVSENYISDAINNDLADNQPVLRCGRVLLGDPSDLPITVRTLSQKLRWSPAQNSAAQTSLIDAVMGCNMSMRKEIIEQVGPFDERFGSGTSIPAGEDADFGFRVYAAGFGLEYVPNMTMHHFHGRKTKAQANKLMRGYLIGAGAVYAKHFIRNPRLCRAAYWDAKHAIRELYLRKNLYMPELGISYCTMMKLMFIGAAYFTKVLFQTIFIGRTQ